MTDDNQRFRGVLDVASAAPEHRLDSWNTIQVPMGSLERERLELAAEKEAIEEDRRRLHEKEAALDAKMSALDSVASDLGQVHAHFRDNNGAIKQLLHGINQVNTEQASILSQFDPDREGSLQAYIKEFAGDFTVSNEHITQVLGQIGTNVDAISARVQDEEVKKTVEALSARLESLVDSTRGISARLGDLDALHTMADDIANKFCQKADFTDFVKSANTVAERTLEWIRQSDRLVEYQDANEALVQEGLGYKDKLQRVQSREEGLRRAASRAEEQVTSLQLEVKNAKISGAEQAKSLTRRIDELEELIRAWGSRAEGLEKERDRLRDKVSRLEHRLKATQDEVHHSQQQCRDADDKYKSEVDRADALALARTTAKDRVSELEKRLAVSEAMVMQSEAIKQAINSHADKLVKACEDVADAQADAAEVRKDNKVLEEQLVNAHEMLASRTDQNRLSYGFDRLSQLAAEVLLVPPSERRFDVVDVATVTSRFMHGQFAARF